MKLLKNGTILSIFFICSCATLSGCKDDGPPTEWCSWYSDGTARCLQRDGETLVTKDAEELEGYLGTNPRDAAARAKWCRRRRR